MKLRCRCGRLGLQGPGMSSSDDSDDMAAYLAGLGKLPNLTELKLDFMNCSQLADVTALGAALEKLESLESVILRFEGCSQLPESNWSQNVG